MALADILEASGDEAAACKLNGFASFTTVSRVRLTPTFGFGGIIGTVPNFRAHAR
jgi:hypothetical protein